ATQALMIKGKKCFKGEGSMASWAERVAQGIWQELMGDNGSFGSRLGYIKKITDRANQQRSEIWICDPLGIEHERLVAQGKIYVAPYWISNQILFSEFTQSNVRLMSYSLKTRKLKPLWNLSGTVAGVCCNKQGKECLYGRSGGIWHYIFDDTAKQGKHKLLIKEQGICSSPCWLPNGEIVYGCQGVIKIYKPKDNNAYRRLTDDGYCVGPNYSEIAHSVVYSKEVKGIMQLFCYSFDTQKHEQVTFDAGNKIDPCWSPCGQYIAYCYRFEKSSSIVTIHIGTKKSHTLTQTDDYCSYPAWSSYP
ncbi:MAG TPA: hypothetical protein VHA52_06420, partial [Candidatus Babeliaceae bacterium]|nr:hypothetical protein [Candidatus Babeliaceae bacterium]